ncbi:hypothetical protein RLEG12_18525 [Rhizobium leguminosarum bv. trifolii CB782]|nr:hypothetical protein RLEG12_18525 [Rhizobium leguminosarum bv. trifolii CB782]
MTLSRRTIGYALAIDHHRDVAYFLDGSPVLSPSAVVANDNGPRRLELIENPGQQLNTSRCRRVVGDVFCADIDTASFVKDAVQEKLARDAAAVAAGTFRIFGTDIRIKGGEAVLKLAATRLADSETLTFEMVLESGDFTRQAEGQWLFTRLCRALRISDIEDADLLVGQVASVKELPGGSIDFCAAKAA